MNLYNEERPHDLSGIVGQEKVVKILSKDFENHSFKQVYLFTGVRGTGKTTFARMIAEAVNCESPKANGCGCGECASCREIRAGQSLDVMELDAASNNSVDDIRELLSMVAYKPVRKKKVYILDECHMLSTAASNALLKCLEEPPRDVIFILCTTELHKVLPTIVSRASRYEFEKINTQAIAAHLAEVCQKHGKAAQGSALSIIAKAADGGMRDALSILEQFFGEEEISEKLVLETLGMTPPESCFTLLSAIAEKNPAAAAMVVRQVSGKGGSLPYLIEECFSVLLDLVQLELYGEAPESAGQDYCSQLIGLSGVMDSEAAFHTMDNLQDAYFRKSSGALEFALEAAVMRSVYNNSLLAQELRDIELLKSEVTSLTQQVKAGTAAPSNIQPDIPAMDTGEAAKPQPMPEYVGDTPMQGGDNEEAGQGTGAVCSTQPDGFTNVLDDECPFLEDDIPDDRAEDNFAAPSDGLSLDSLLASVKSNSPAGQAAPVSASNTGTESLDVTIQDDPDQDNPDKEARKEPEASEPSGDSLFGDFARLFQFK